MYAEVRTPDGKIEKFNHATSIGYGNFDEGIVEVAFGMPGGEMQYQTLQGTIIFCEKDDRQP